MFKNAIMFILALCFTSHLALAGLTKSTSTPVSEPNVFAFDIYLVRTTTAALAKTDTMLAGRVSVPYLISLLQDSNTAQLAQHIRMLVREGERNSINIVDQKYLSDENVQIPSTGSPIRSPIRSRTYRPYAFTTKIALKSYKHIDNISAGIEFSYEGFTAEPNTLPNESKLSFDNIVALKPDLPTIVHSIYGSNYAYFLVVRAEIIDAKQ